MGKIKNRKIKNTMLDEAITKKAQINIGSKFCKLRNIEYLNNSLSYDYREIDTIFKKYRSKYLDLQEEYLEELQKIGINKDLFVFINDRVSNSDKERLGVAIGRAYPKILDIEKANAWNDLNTLIAEIMTGNY